MDKFTIKDEFMDYKENYSRVFHNENGIVIEKDIVKRKDGSESVSYKADFLINGNTYLIGFGSTKDEIEQKVNQWISALKNQFQFVYTISE